MKNLHFTSPTLMDALIETHKDIIEDDTSPYEYIKQITVSRPYTVKFDSYLRNIDYESKYYNVIGSYRYTTDIPERFDNKIHIFGSSTAFGACSEDKHTIASHLQRELNDINIPYKVIVHAIRGIYAFSEITYNYIKSNRNVFKKNDIIVFIMDNVSAQYLSHNVQTRMKTETFFNSCFENMGIEYHSLFEMLNKEHFQGIYCDFIHFNYKGNALIAKSLFSIIKTKLEKRTHHDALDESAENNKSNVVYNNEKLLKMSSLNIPQLNSYINEIKLEDVNPSSRVGAVVVNCNPFTKGHRYLIEKAYGEVEYLYVFVVEEDKSQFPFLDRLFLVKEGLSDLKNCVVVRSGEFMISKQTFPGYFDKESSPFASVSPTLDAEIFASCIAPTLGITIRFVGNEPNCGVTRQYNSTLFEILPQYGVEVKMFERLGVHGEVISASRVRELLKHKQFEEIKQLVPKTTYDYLMRNYHGDNEL